LAVNLAPFIGSTLRSKDHVLCQAIELREGSVLVRTEAPYRSLSLWMETNWVDQVVESADTLAERITARVPPS
jgi:hypothetical protein